MQAPGPALVVFEFYLRRRLITARAAMPRNMPTRIDSSGKPGIGGNAIGVETELELAATVVSGVVVGFSTVIVTGPVFTVTVDETVLEVTEVEVDVLATDVLEVLDVVGVVLVVLRVVVIETVVPVAPPGGSR